jgi:long-chain acyl-CoA synthetase
LLDRLVAKPIRDTFGGRLRVAVSGGAPLATEVARFLVAMGVPLVEGYGLTEASPVVTATALDDIWPGSAGRPLSGIELAVSAEQELLVRSPAVMTGYWSDEAQTAEAIDRDGWLHTGDSQRSAMAACSFAVGGRTFKSSRPARRSTRA